MNESGKNMLGEKMKPWKMIPLVLVIFGCSSVSGIISTRASTRTKGIPASVTETPNPMKYSSGPFTLTIFSPVDDAVVHQPQVTLLGEVSSDAVVTINETTNFFYQGSFSQTVSLEEGINAIQIVASDMEGNEVDAILTVTYQP
jgi:hypothetical protein